VYHEILMTWISRFGQFREFGIFSGICHMYIHPRWIHFFWSLLQYRWIHLNCKNLYCKNIYQMQYMYIHISKISDISDMGWLRWVGCLKIQVSLQNTGLFCRALLQKRPIFLNILLIVATPYVSDIFFCNLYASDKYFCNICTYIYRQYLLNV